MVFQEQSEHSEDEDGVKPPELPTTGPPDPASTQQPAPPEITIDEVPTLPRDHDFGDAETGDVTPHQQRPSLSDVSEEDEEGGTIATSESGSELAGGIEKVSINGHHQEQVIERSKGPSPASSEMMDDDLEEHAMPPPMPMKQAHRRGGVSAEPVDESDVTPYQRKVA